MTETSPISNAISSASYNIVLQVLMRILSSVSNALIFRLIAKEALGVINVRLLLLYSTCHCLSRESFRRSCLSKFDVHSLEKKFNLLWMVLPVCAVCACFLRYFWLYLFEIPDPEVVPHYSSGVNAILISVLIECLAEPIYVFSQSCYFVKLKVVTEGLMLTVRSVTMVISLHKWPHLAIQCFCFSQILGSIIYTSTFYIYFIYYLNSDHQKKSPLLISSIRRIFPQLPNFSIDMKDLHLTWSFFKQTILKQLLTEGERYLMTFFELLSFAEQGLYDVVNNLGSMAARFIFLPIEDSAYLLFTQLLSREKTKSQEDISLSLNLLQNIMKLMMLLGFTILVFGYSYSQLLLFFYGGNKLSAGLGLSLMRWHCLYVLLIAVNGVSEGFKFAVMSHHQIDKYNKNLVILSIGFLLTSYYLVTWLGGVGFILANCLNMTFRILHSFHFIFGYFKLEKAWLIKAIPHYLVLCTLGISFVLTSISEIFLCCNYGFKLWICHLVFGGICFAVFLFTVWTKENSLLFIYNQWKLKESVESKPKSL